MNRGLELDLAEFYDGDLAPDRQQDVFDAIAGDEGELEGLIELGRIHRMLEYVFLIDSPDDAFVSNVVQSLRDGESGEFINGVLNRIVQRNPNLAAKRGDTSGSSRRSDGLSDETMSTGVDDVQTSKRKKRILPFIAVAATVAACAILAFMIRSGSGSDPSPENHDAYAVAMGSARSEMELAAEAPDISEKKLHWEQARQYSEAALLAKPDDEDASDLVRTTVARSKNIEAALESLAVAEAEMELVKRASSADEARRHAKAAGEAVLAVLSVAPGHAPAQALQSEIDTLNGALNDFQQALERARNARDLARNQGGIAESRKLWESVSEQCGNALERFPGDPEADSLRKMADSMRIRLDETEKVLAGADRFLQAQEKPASLLDEKTQAEELVAQLRKLADERPGDETIHERLDVICEKVKALEIAVADMEEVRRVIREAQSSTSHEAAMRHWNSAKRLADSFTAVHGQTPEFGEIITMIESKLAHYDSAVLHIQTADQRLSEIRDDMTSSDLKRILETAQFEQELAVSAFPDDPELKTRLNDVTQRLARIEQDTAALKKAAELLESAQTNDDYRVAYKEATEARRLCESVLSGRKEDPEANAILESARKELANIDSYVDILKKATAEYKTAKARHSMEKWKQAIGLFETAAATRPVDHICDKSLPAIRNAMWTDCYRHFNQACVIRGHTDHINNVAFDPAGDVLMTTSWDGSLKLWSVRTGECRKTLADNKGFVRTAQYSTNDSILVTALSNGEVRILDGRTGETRRSISESEKYRGASVSLDGRRIAAWTSQGFVDVWDVDGNDPRTTFSDGTESLQSVTFSPDGSSLLAISKENRILRWNTETGKQDLSIDPDGRALVARWTQSGDILALQITDGSEKVTSSVSLYRSSSPEWTYRYDGFLYGLAASADGRWVGASTGDGAVVLDAETGAELRRLTGHDRPVGVVTFSPNGNALLTASGDGTAKIWNPADGTTFSILRGGDASLLDAAFSRDGETVYTLSKDNTVRIWRTVPADGDGEDGGEKE